MTGTFALLALFATLLLATSLGCGFGAIRSAMRGETVEGAIGLALTLVYGLGFAGFAFVLEQAL